MRFPRFINEPEKILWFELDEYVILFLVVSLSFVIGVQINFDSLWILSFPFAYFLAKKMAEFKRDKPKNVLMHYVWFKGFHFLLGGIKLRYPVKKKVQYVKPLIPSFVFPPDSSFQKLFSHMPSAWRNGSPAGVIPEENGNGLENINGKEKNENGSINGRDIISGDNNPFVDDAEDLLYDSGEGGAEKKGKEGKSTGKKKKKKRKKKEEKSREQDKDALHFKINEYWGSLHGAGIFKREDGRVCAIFLLSPRVFMGEEDLRTLTSLFSGPWKAGTVFQFILICSDAIYYPLQMWLSRKKRFKSIFMERAKFLLSATEKKLEGFGSPVRTSSLLFVYSPPKKYSHPAELWEDREFERNLSIIKGTLTSLEFFPQPCPPEFLAYQMFVIFNPAEPHGKFVYSPSKRKVSKTEDMEKSNSSPEGAHNTGGKSKKKSKKEQWEIHVDFSSQYLSSSEVIEHEGGFTIRQRAEKPEKKEGEEEAGGEEYISLNYSTFSLRDTLEDEIDFLRINLLVGDFYDSIKQNPCHFMISETVIIDDKVSTLAGLYKDLKRLERWARTPEDRKRLDSLNELISRIQSGQNPVRVLLTIPFWTPDDIWEIKDFFLQRLGQAGFRFQHDTFTTREVFIQSLPGEFETDTTYIKALAKHLRLDSMSAAQLVPAQADWVGNGSSILFITRRGFLAGLDIFKTDGMMNFSIIAGSGSGKSFFANELIFSYLAEGAKVYIVDIGRSYEKICMNVDGQVIEMSENDSIQVFEDVEIFDESGGVHEDITMLVDLLSLITMREDSPPEPYEKAVLEKIILGLAWWKYTTLDKKYSPEEVPPVFRPFLKHKKLVQDVSSFTFTDIYHVMRNSSEYLPDLPPRVQEDIRKRAEALFPFTMWGQYGKMFNRPSTISFKKDMVVVDLEKIARRPELKKVVFFLLMYYIASQVYLGDRSQRKIVLIDEAWDLLKNSPGVAKFIEGLYRKIRKYNGAVGTITQWAKDYFFNDTTQAAIEQSYWLFLLRQAQDSINTLVDRGFLPAGFFASYAASARTVKGQYSEIFVKAQSGLMGLFRFVVDRKSYFMYTTAAEDVALIDQLRKKGLSVEKAIDEVVLSKFGRQLPPPKTAPIFS